METKSVAIDGPAGAGKSTIARKAAQRLGLIYVDTGALYRSVGLFALKNGVDSRDEQGVTALLPEINIEMKYGNDGAQRMLLNSEDVTDDIRSPEASVYASGVAVMASVRDFLLSTQRDMALKYDVIMDGRDIGTIVLPHAGLKVFLTADPVVRADRRYRELREKNVDTTLEAVLNEITERDKKDSEREVAPLKAADDAIILDTTALDLDGSVNALCELIAKRFGL
ncbi:MAG: (d)CMP kinase [Oscillospiraceae bacterium]|nr:(d)CMP kinase [Oscillospiraceae bacterium]